MYGKISNGFVEIDFGFEVTEQIYNFLPFYVLSDGLIQSDYSNYNINTATGSNNVVYAYISPYNKGQSSEIPSEIETSLNAGEYERYKVNLNEFVYDDDIKAYYFDFKTKYDCKIEIDDYAKSWATWSGDYVYYYSYDGVNGKWYAYVNEGTTIEYSLDSYTIKSGDDGIILKIEYSDSESRYVIRVYN